METVLRSKISCDEGMTSGIWTLDHQTGIIQQFLSIPLTKEEKTTAKSILEAPATPERVVATLLASIALMAKKQVGKRKKCTVVPKLVMNDKF